MSDDKKNCDATLISFRLFSSPEFLVKFTHSTKLPRLRQTRSKTSCSARSAWLPRGASSRRRKWCPSNVRLCDHAQTDRDAHSAWNKISSGNHATAIDRQT